MTIKNPKDYVFCIDESCDEVMVAYITQKDYWNDNQSINSVHLSDNGETPWLDWADEEEESCFTAYNIKGDVNSGVITEDEYRKRLLALGLTEIHF